MYSRQFTQFILGLVLLVSSSFAYSLKLTLNYDGASEVRITGGPWGWSSEGAETTMDANGNWFITFEVPVEVNEVAYSWIVQGETEFLIDNIVNMECQQDLADGRIVSDLENYAVRIWRPGYIEVIDNYDSCSDSNHSNGLSYFIVSDSDVRVNGCANELNCPSNIVIPETYSNLQVTSILANGFRSIQISAVEIPGTINTISESAFYNSSLAEVILNEGILAISDSSFSNNLLSEIDLPNSMTFIGALAFSFNEISSLVVPHNVQQIESGAFEGNFINSIHFEGQRPYIAFNAFDDNDISLITYCTGADGWPGIPVEGVIPQAVDTCASNNVTYATFDIDQNGSVGALSDGLILLRYFFGLRGEGLITDVLAEDATRTSASDIEAYIESHMP